MSTPSPHPFFARIYTRLSAAAERSGAAEHRHRLLDGLSGEVVEVGAGNGSNFHHYPTTVARSPPSSLSPTFGGGPSKQPPRRRSTSPCWTAQPSASP